MSKRSDALRKLISAFPPPRDLADLMDGLRNQDDRSAAIISCAISEGVLERLLITSFRNNDPDLVQAIFGQNGPMSTLSGKILIGTAIGCLNYNMKSELTRMKNIRNVFAHAVHNVTFETPEIKKDAESFKMLEAMRKVGLEKNGPTDLFTGKAGYLMVATIMCIIMDEMITQMGGDPVYGK